MTNVIKHEAIFAEAYKRYNIRLLKSKIHSGKTQIYVSYGNQMPVLKQTLLEKSSLRLHKDVYTLLIEFPDLQTGKECWGTGEGVAIDLFNNCQRTFFHFIECHHANKHDLDFATWKHAQHLGVDLPPTHPANVVTPLYLSVSLQDVNNILDVPIFDSTVMPDLNNCIFLDETTRDKTSLTYAVMQAYGDKYFVAETISEAYKGFEWFEQLAQRTYKAEVISLNASDNSKVVLSTCLSSQRSGERNITLVLTNKQDTSQQLWCELPYYHDSGYDWPHHLFINPNFKQDITVTELVNYTFAVSYVQAEEETIKDEDDILDEFREDAEHLAAKLLLNEEEFIKHKIESTIRRQYLANFVPTDKEVHIRMYWETIAPYNTNGFRYSIELRDKMN